MALCAYQLDRSSGERVNKIFYGGIDLSDFTIGENCILTVAQQSRIGNRYSIGWTSTIRWDDERGDLVPLSTSDGYEALGLGSLEDLKSHRGVESPDSTATEKSTALDN